MAMTNKLPESVEAPASFGGLQLRVAVLCGLIQTLDGYDLSATCAELAGGSSR